MNIGLWSLISQPIVPAIVMQVSMLGIKRSKIVEVVGDILVGVVIILENPQKAILFKNSYEDLFLGEMLMLRLPLITR